MSLNSAELRKLPQGGYVVFNADHAPSDFRIALAAFSDIASALEFLRVELMPDEERRAHEERVAMSRAMQNSAPLRTEGAIRSLATKDP